MDDYRVSGAKVRSLRVRRRMTQRALAEKTGLSPNQISRIEQEVHTPRFSTVDRLAEALQVEPDDLIDYPLAAV